MSLGYRDYGEHEYKKEAPAYQAERYFRPADVEPATAQTQARYGETERESGTADVIGGVAGTAAALEAAGVTAIKDTIADTAKESIVRRTVTEEAASKANTTGARNAGLIKNLSVVAGREIVASIGSGGDELTDRAGRQALKYGYKSGKYAAASAISVIGGTFRIVQNRVLLSKDVKAGLLTKKDARILSLKKVQKSIAGSGTTIKKILKTELVQGIEDFRGSDDLGMKALTAPKDVYVKGKRALQLVKSIAHGAKAVAAGAKKLFANPVFIKISLIAGVVIVLASLVMAVVATISSIIPTISLKSDDKELTRTYEHVTKLDTEITHEIREIENSIFNSDIDHFHYYLNGVPTTADNTLIYTNADYILMFLDTKYDDYAYDKFIHGLFGGTNVKEVVTAIHNALHSYTTHNWEEEIKHVESWHNPVTGESGYNTWTEIIKHMDINVSTQSFEDYLTANIDTMLNEDEQETFKVISDVGAYTARVELGSPFIGQDYSISSRWGWRIHPIDGDVSMHKGMDIPQTEGTPINNVMFGNVTFTGYDADGFGNYCIVTSTDEKKEILYAHLRSVAVSVGQQILKGDIVGYVGNTGASTGAHLHIEYSIENGFNTNPAFFLDGI